VAYEMLAGAPPFTGPTAQSVLARHAVDPVPPLHTVRGTVPSAVEVAIERALAKVPADRFTTAAEFAQALEAESPVAPTRWPGTHKAKRIAVALVAVTVVLGLGIRFMTTSARAAVLPSASKIAVLPLLSLGGDTALIRLGRDLANTISASLAGVGGIQLVDRLSIATSSAGKELSPADGAALARRFGATSFVEGTLVGAGDQVRLDLGLYGTERLEPLARGVTVTAHRDSIRLLTDSASLGLLRQVWRRGEPPTPSLAAVTTRSLPALRAFLEGERQLAAGRWDDAQLAYHAATDADSSFGLAWWRYAFAKWWIEEEPDSAILSAARRHSSELPERDRLLAELWGDTQERGVTQEILDRGRMLTQRFPSYWPTWFEYGDLLFHLGPMLGHDHREAIQAFQRVLELNPGLVPAWHHLQDAVVLTSDTALLAKTLIQLDSLEPLDPRAPPHDHRRLTRWQIPFRRGRVFAGRDADSLVADLVSLHSLLQQELLSFQFLVIGGPAAQIALSRQVIIKTPWRAAAAIHRNGIALSWAARGAWDSALSAIDDYARRGSDLAELTPDEVQFLGGGADLADLDRYRMAVIGTWLGALERRSADARRQAAVKAVHLDGSPRRQVELWWLDGLLSASQGDLAGLRRARKQLVESDTALAALAIRALGAFELELQGKLRQAADSMAASAWARGWVGPSWGIIRLAAARWLAAQGDLEQAARLLPWWQSMVANFDFIHGVEVLWGPCLLEAARVEAARGHSDLARDSYQQFLWLYDLPSPRLRPVVEDARAALRGLE
jgi:tetratricopeptide (TPR) repeat protein/TolB-like protein